MKLSSVFSCILQRGFRAGDAAQDHEAILDLSSPPRSDADKPRVLQFEERLLNAMIHSSLPL